MFYSGDSDAERERSQISDRRPPIAVAALRCNDPRRRLLDGMIATVARRGYDRTTVSRVLSAANVPEALFSEHFHDKQDCFTQAVEELIGRAERAAIERFAGQEPWPQQVRAGLASLLRALADDPAGARVVFVEMLAAGPAAAQRHRRALAVFTALMEQGSPQSADAARLPPQTSEAIVGGVASILHRRVLQGETTKLPELHGDLTYFALLPYLDQESAIGASRLRPAA